MKALILLIINTFIVSALLILVTMNRYLKKNEQLIVNSGEKGNKKRQDSLMAFEKIELIGFKLKWFQKVERKYILESGIAAHFPLITLRRLTICALGSATWLAYQAWVLFEIEGIAISGALVGFVLPFQIVEIYRIYRFRQLINALPGFYSVLQRWAQINEDIYYCLGQLENSGVDAIIAKPFKTFLLETTSGAAKTIAFYNLKRNFHGTPVIQFVRCIERLVEQRGDLVKMLQSFENESYQLQEEITERQNTQIKYKLIINGLSLASFLMIYVLLNTNRVLSGFYVETIMGKMLLSALALLMALSFLGGIKYDRSY